MYNLEGSPTSSLIRTDKPPGCKFLKRDKSYTLASMMTHYVDMLNQQDCGNTEALTRSLSVLCWRRKREKVRTEGQEKTDGLWKLRPW